MMLRIVPTFKLVEKKNGTYISCGPFRFDARSQEQTGQTSAESKFTFKKICTIQKRLLNCKNSFKKIFTAISSFVTYGLLCK